MEGTFLRTIMERILAGEISKVTIEGGMALGIGSQHRPTAFASATIAIDGQSDAGSFTVSKCVQAVDLVEGAHQMLARAEGLIGTE